MDFWGYVQGHQKGAATRDATEVTTLRVAREGYSQGHCRTVKLQGLLKR